MFRTTFGRTTVRRIAAVAGTGALAGLLVASPALAHVTVDPSTATRGGYATFTFQVPNESDKASTVKLEIVLPAGAPIASMRARPVPGWRAAIQKVALAKPVESDGRTFTEAVSRVVFTASSPAAGVQPGQFQQFAISGGPLPKVDKLVFKVLQTYGDGTVARWIEEQTGAEEPEYPAPTVTLAQGEGNGDHHDGTGENDAAAVNAAKDDHDDGRGSAGTAALAVGGLLAGVAGLVVGTLALFRTRRRPQADPAPTAASSEDTPPEEA